LVVRIKVKLTSKNKTLETVTLINTGFETNQPEILLPIKLAEKLNIYPPKAGSTIQEYNVVGGKTLIIKTPEKIKIQVLIKNKINPSNTHHLRIRR